MFYLLKGTIKRDDSGDIILDKREIESLHSTKVIKEDGETYYRLVVSLKSSDDWQIFFNTKEEMKEVIQSIIEESSGILKEFQSAVDDRKAEKEKMIKKMMS